MVYKIFKENLNRFVNDEMYVVKRQFNANMEDIINDEILGELEFQNGNVWVGCLGTPVLNSDGELLFAVQDKNKEGILDVQREAYKNYLQNEEKYKSIVTDYLLDHYKWVNEYFMRTVSGIDESFHKDVVTDKQLYKAIDFCGTSSFAETVVSDMPLDAAGTER